MKFESLYVNNMICVLQLLQNLIADELMDILTCNLTKTIYNK